MRIHLRSLNVTEPCPLDLNSWVAFECLRSHFSANMFSLTITISPYEKRLSTSCLSLDILCDIFLILWKRISGKIVKQKMRSNHLSNRFDNLGSEKELLGWRVSPTFVSWGNIKRGEMPQDRSHDRIAITPLSTEIESE